LGQSVASDRLKMVEIRCANVDKRVHKILSVLTTYGIPLEKINIQHTSRIPGSKCELNCQHSPCYFCFLPLFNMFIHYRPSEDKNLKMDTRILLSEICMNAETPMLDKEIETCFCLACIIQKTYTVSLDFELKYRVCTN
jgi:hypothetical protein